ncbi:hypothetical protein EVAR_36774_1 [Eumeta japonica]|uniref:Uncharacterized protein n=1 Tax=Eumeta variegata TaxID=151549 RepID=A0A4C1X006_EUMVA|nr:hypothetical protein EVAR_36774_1 [Eumeta japonica]
MQVEVHRRERQEDIRLSHGDGSECSLFTRSTCNERRMTFPRSSGHLRAESLNGLALNMLAQVELNVREGYGFFCMFSQSFRRCSWIFMLGVMMCLRCTVSEYSKKLTSWFSKEMVRIISVDADDE